MELDQYLDLMLEVDECNASFRKEIEDCSLLEFRVLDLIAHNPKSRLKDLSQIRSVYAQGVGRLVARLEERGLVDAITCTRDRRAKQIELTAAGRRLYERCMQVMGRLCA